VSEFVAQGNAGFQMTFDNGYTVSVRWQPGTYTEHNDWSTRKNEFSDWWNQPVSEANLVNGWASRTAEVAVIRRDEDDSKESKWYNPHTLELGDPEGWLSTDEVATIISNVQSINVGLKRKVLDILNN
jgi:hypothetical protein